MKNDGTQHSAGESSAIIREATAFSAASYLFQLISVVRGFVIAWFLGPALYGVWNIFKTFLETGNYVAAGASQAVARELPYHRAREELQRNSVIVSSTLAWVLSLSALLALLALGLSFLDVAQGWRSEIRVAALAFVLNALHLYVPNQLKGEKKIYLLSLYYVAYASINCVLGLLLMSLFGITGLLWGMIIANAVLLAWLLRAGHLPARIAWHWSTSRGLIAIGFPILMVAVAPKLMASIDKLIIFSMVDSTATGYYSMASFLSETINYIPLALATVLFPRLMYQKGKGADLKKMAYLYDKPMLLLAGVIPVLLGLMVINIGLLIRYVLPEYQPAIPVLHILIIGLFFSVVWSVPRGLMVVFDKQAVFITAIPLFLLIGAGLNVAALKLGYGIRGVALASVMFYFMVSLTANVYALKILQKGRAASARALLEIHLPFSYTLVVLWLVRHFIVLDSEFLTCAVQSAVFALLCLPPLLRVNRKLNLLQQLHVALFKRAE